jgi:hypothetical protein
MQAIAPLTGTASIQKGSAQPSQARVQQVSTEPAPEARARASAAAPPIVNPSVRFDLKLGIVVVEFFNDSGEVANSAPSPRQLKAYESGMNMRSGPMPLPRDLPAGTNEDGLAVVA